MILTGETFEATVKANPLILVKFYAPWCGHCKRVAPEFEKAAGILKGRAALANVDATVETVLADQYKIEGYPTFYFFRRGVPEEYSGGRESAGFVSWVEEQMESAVKTFASESELKAELKRRQTKVYFISKGSQVLADIFKKIAEVHRPLGTWGHLDSEEPPLVEVHRGVDEMVQLTGPNALDAGKVFEFIHSEMLPPFGEIGEDNYEPYLAKSDKGIVWACFSPDTFRVDAVLHTAAFKEVAAAFPQFPVVYTDTKEYEEHVKSELGCTDYPTLVVQLGNLTAGHDAKRYKTILVEGEINGKALTAWVQAVLSGQVEEDDGLDELDDPEDYAEVDAEGGDLDPAAEGANAAAGAEPVAKTDL